MYYEVQPGCGLFSVNAFSSELRYFVASQWHKHASMKLNGYWIKVIHTSQRKDDLCVFIACVWVLTCVVIPPECVIRLEGELQKNVGCRDFFLFLSNPDECRKKRKIHYGAYIHSTSTYMIVHASHAVPVPQNFPSLAFAFPRIWTPIGNSLLHYIIRSLPGDLNWQGVLTPLTIKQLLEAYTWYTFEARGVGKFTYVIIWIRDICKLVP